MALPGPPGLLLFVRAGILSAVPFDEQRLEVTGPPATVVQGVYGDKTTGLVSCLVFGDGTLAYVPGDPQETRRRLVWRDLKGVTRRRVDTRRPRTRSPWIRHCRQTPGASRSWTGPAEATTCGSTTWLDRPRRGSRLVAISPRLSGRLMAAPCTTRPSTRPDRKSTVSRKPLDGSRQAETRLHTRRANLSQAGR